MQKHVKTYLNHFGYGEQDVILCEWCQSVAVDIHHINGRGKNKDVIQNLMALCRRCHTAAHECKITKQALIDKHNSLLHLLT